MDLFKKLKNQNNEFREGLNPFRNTGCCGGGLSKEDKDNYDSIISKDDPINF